MNPTTYIVSTLEVTRHDTTVYDVLLPMMTSFATQWYDSGIVKVTSPSRSMFCFYCVDYSLPSHEVRLSAHIQDNLWSFAGSMVEVDVTCDVALQTGVSVSIRARWDTPRDRDSLLLAGEPLGMDPRHILLESFLAPYFAAHRERVLHVGDILQCTGHHNVSFQFSVTACDPSPYCLVGDKTQVRIEMSLEESPKQSGARRLSPLRTPPFTESFTAREKLLLGHKRRLDSEERSLAMTRTSVAPSPRKPLEREQSPPLPPVVLETVVGASLRDILQRGVDLFEEARAILLLFSPETTLLDPHTTHQALMAAQDDMRSFSLGAEMYHQGHDARHNDLVLEVLGVETQSHVPGIVAGLQALDIGIRSKFFSRARKTLLVIYSHESSQKVKEIVGGRGGAGAGAEVEAHHSPSRQITASRYGLSLPKVEGSLEDELVRRRRECAEIHLASLKRKKVVDGPLLTNLCARLRMVQSELQEALHKIPIPVIRQCTVYSSVLENCEEALRFARLPRTTDQVVTKAAHQLAELRRALAEEDRTAIAAHKAKLHETLQATMTHVEEEMDASSRRTDGFVVSATLGLHQRLAVVIVELQKACDLQLLWSPQMTFCTKILEGSPSCARLKHLQMRLMRGEAGEVPREYTEEWSMLTEMAESLFPELLIKLRQFSSLGASLALESPL